MFKKNIFGIGTKKSRVDTGILNSNESISKEKSRSGKFNLLVLVMIFVLALIIIPVAMPASSTLKLTLQQEAVYDKSSNLFANSTNKTITGYNLQLHLSNDLASNVSVTNATNNNFSLLILYV